MEIKRFGKNLTFLLAALTLTLLCLFLIRDDALYRQTIVRVTEVSTESLGLVKGENGVSEKSYRQSVTGIVQNGSRKGTAVTFENGYTQSEIRTTKYSVGDRLFVRLQQGGDSGGVVVLGVKRDVWLAGVLALFVCTLCFFYQGRGCLILASVMINVALIFVSLNCCDVQSFFSWQWLFLIVLFCAVTLLLVSGFHRQTFGAIVSTLATALLVLLLYQVTVNRSAVVPYDMMPDSFGSLPIEDVFRFSVMAGSIGAIMDVSIAIHASVWKLLENEETRDLKSVFRSMRQIGADLMGTMVNVLFFSYVSQSLPMVILKINSGYSVGSIFRYEMIFDFVRFLLGAIGIVLAIPVSEGVALMMCRKGRR
jgi:uncharacterized membrane protein